MNKPSKEDVMWEFGDWHICCICAFYLWKNELISFSPIFFLHWKKCLHWFVLSDIGYFPSDPCVHCIVTFWKITLWRRRVSYDLGSKEGENWCSLLNLDLVSGMEILKCSSVFLTYSQGPDYNMKDKMSPNWCIII